jgi:hypothetical protein
MHQFYLDGQKAAKRHKSMEEAIYALLDTSFIEDQIFGAFWQDGFRGYPEPRWVTGWRLGKIPAIGYSYNYRDGYPHAGVSLAGIDGERTTWESVSRMFIEAEKRPKVRVAGWLIHQTGGDGEPLVVGAIQL